MRSFAEMPVWLLSMFSALFIVMVIGIIAGLAITLSSKDAMNKAFGILTLILSMFVSIPVFLIGLITTVPAESVSSSFGLMNLLTEVVVWSSLLPLVITPAFIGAFLIKQYHEITGSTKSKKGNSVTIFERYRNPAKNLMNDWKTSRADHKIKAALADREKLQMTN